MAKIVCVGIACLDYLFRLKKEKPLGVEKVTAVKDWLAQGGGMASTAAVTAARLGADVKLITKVGNDEVGNKIAEELWEEGIKLKTSIADSGRSPVSFVKVMLSGERKFYFYPGEGLRRPPQEEKDFEGASVVLVDKAYPDLSLEAAKIASQRRIKVVADLEEKIGKEERRLLEFVDHAIIDREAAKDIDPEIDEALKKLTQKVDLAAMTDGERGTFYSTGEEVEHQPAYKVKVVDTTGAGDVFHGAYSYALANKWSVGKSMRFASAAAALACRKMGGRSAIPSLSELKEFLENHERDQT